MMACFYLTVQNRGIPFTAVTLVCFCQFDVIKRTGIETQNAVALKLKFNTPRAKYLKKQGIGEKLAVKSLNTDPRLSLDLSN